MQSTRRELLQSIGGATVALAATGANVAAETSRNWPMYGADLANSGHAREAVGPTADVGPAWEFETGGQMSTAPAVVDGAVYVGSRDGNVYALSAATGTEQWRFETDSDVRSSPAVVDGTVYVGGQDGVVRAIDAGGEEVWRFGTGGAVMSSPAVANGAVYVGSRDGRLYAIDAEDGTERWQFETGFWIESSPALVGGTLYVGSDDGYLYAVDADSGEERWRFGTGDRVPGSPAAVDGTVYVGSLDQSVYALDAEDGEELWRFGTDGAITSSPAVADGTVYVGSRNHDLYAIDAEDGGERWQFDTGRQITASPAVTDDTVYVGSENGHVFGIDEDSGEELWRFDTGQPVTAGPAVTDGTVYVGSNDHTVYALEEGERLPADERNTPTPGTGNGGGVREFTFLLLPATAVGFVALLVGSLYAVYRAGLLDWIDTAHDTDSESTESADPSDSQSQLSIWELAVEDVVARADATETTATQDFVVTKHLDSDTLASPVVAYEIESVRSEPARIRLAEALVDSATGGAQSRPDNWTLEEGTLVFEAVVEPGSTVTTMVGRSDCPPERAGELLDRPEISVEAIDTSDTDRTG